MKNTARNCLIVLTVCCCVFILGFMFGRYGSESVPIAKVSSLLPTDPFEPEDVDMPDVVDGKININAASTATLLLLPDIGPSTAEKIIAYREENGPFQNIDELKLVDGLGTKRFEQIKKYITVGE